MITLIPARNALLQRLIDHVRSATDSDFGIIRLVTRAYIPLQMPDAQAGMVSAAPAFDEARAEAEAIGATKTKFLVRVATAPVSLEASLNLFISANEGISGDVLANKTFKNHGTRPNNFLSTIPDADWRTESIFAVPLRSGDEVRGIMTLESRMKYAYTDTLQGIILQIAALASNVITTTSLRLSELQAQLLRSFEQAITKQRTVE